MKCVIFLALVVIATAQQHRPDHNHGDPLHNLVHAEVQQILSANAGVTSTVCTTRCDALFDLSAGHDEQMTDHLCGEECRFQVDGVALPTGPGGPGGPDGPGGPGAGGQGAGGRN